jgi:hypothetical protein
MNISRRELLLAGAAELWPNFAGAIEEGAPFALHLPELKLDPRLLTYAAVDTSGFTNCQVLILDARGYVVQKSPGWGTEPNTPEGAPLAGMLPGKLPISCRAQIVMQPTRKTIPSVAVAIEQGGSQPLPRLTPAEFGAPFTSDSQDIINRLKEVARLARFIKDPAQPPGGQFQVALSNNSSIFVRIWAGEKAVGEPIYQRKLFDRPSGMNAIPWNLRTSKGTSVPAGRYFAFLLCVPTATALQPTALASYFAVLAS